MDKDDRPVKGPNGIRTEFKELVRMYDTEVLIVVKLNRRHHILTLDAAKRLREQLKGAIA